MTDHNPYVGIQRTVFEQGWKRGRKDLSKAIRDDVEQYILSGGDRQELEVVYDILDHLEQQDA